MSELLTSAVNFCVDGGTEKDRIAVECKTDIPSEKVAKILTVSAFACIKERAVVEKKINYTGRATFYIAFEDQEGELRKTECNTDFSGAINVDRDVEKSKIILTVKNEKTEAELTGLYLAGRAYICVGAEISDSKSENALIGGDGLIVNTCQVSTQKSLGYKSTVYPLEEEFEVNYAVEQVVFQRAQATVTACQCGVGAIIVDGQVEMQAIFLQKGDKKDIIKEARLIPFRVEIECEDAMPANLATARVFEKSLKTNIAVDEDKGGSLVTVGIILEFVGEAYAQNSIDIAVDAFCKTHELDVQVGAIECVEALDVQSCQKELYTPINIEELAEGSEFKCVFGESVEIISQECAESGINVSGVFYGNALYKNAQGKCFTKKIESPFEATLSCTTCAGASYNVIANATCAKAKSSFNGLEVEWSLCVTVYAKKKCGFKFIKGYSLAKEKRANDCAISVYIAVEGEELWSLAKRLNETPEELASANPDLQFPLCGSERIIVYRQK